MSSFFLGSVERLSLDTKIVLIARLFFSIR
jgi:hypothetical protein